jgi:uncharacterized protein DUF1566
MTAQAKQIAQAPLAAPHIGERMWDGTIYAGFSPDTGRPLYAMPADAHPMTFQGAADYVARLQANGHRGWRLPTRRELNALRNNRAAIGGFHLFDPAARWLSSSPYGKWGTWNQRFSDGCAGFSLKAHPASVRFVRD